MKLRLGIGILSAALSMAQTPAAAPGFEVASVKLNPDCGNGRGNERMPSPGRLSIACIGARNLIRIAYESFANGRSFTLKNIEVLGGPGWLDSERYSIDAKAEGGADVTRMAGPMLQALLEDRFKLKVHREARETPVYALTEAKGGHKLTPAKEGSCVVVDFNHLPERPAPGAPPPIYCGMPSGSGRGGTTTLQMHSASLAAFANFLGTNVGRPVIDKTGITGLFDFQVEYAPEISMGGVRLNGGENPGGAALPPAPVDGGPSIFSAVQRLGLKLTPEKDPVDVLVVDHIERPTEN